MVHLSQTPTKHTPNESPPRSSASTSRSLLSNVTIWLLAPITISLLISVHTWNHWHAEVSDLLHPSQPQSFASSRPSGVFPVTYCTECSDGTTKNTKRISLDLVSAQPGRHREPDVTAVILNWSRLPNVIHIATLLCGSLLEDVIAEVFIWNN
ncbi:hypothetical protein SERLADRAFT_381423, partial [Serpula lacrymans var. lacrymans S7.9]